MYRIIYFIIYPFMRLFFPCKVIGRKNFPKKQPMIIICNHLTNVDAVYIYQYFYEKKFTLAKKELFESKVLGYLYRCVGGFPIDRGKVDLKAIKTSLAHLKDGHKLVVFPEGTRNKESEELQGVKNGAAMLALKAKVPILPMHIEKRAKIFRRNKIIVGKPFDLAQFYDQKLNSETLDKASEIITQKLLDTQNPNQ